MIEGLLVTAFLRGPVAMPNGPIALDGLLARAVVERDAIPLAVTAEDCVPVEIPVAREPAGRFYLASVSFGEVDAHENDWVNRRFPTEVAPDGWPGVAADAERAYRTLAPPYWDRTKDVLCAVPRWG